MIIPYAQSHHEQFVLNYQPSSSSGAVPRSPLVQRKLQIKKVTEEKEDPSGDGTFINKVKFHNNSITFLSFFMQSDSNPKLFNLCASIMGTLLSFWYFTKCVECTLL